MNNSICWLHHPHHRLPKSEWDATFVSAYAISHDDLWYGQLWFVVATGHYRSHSLRVLRLTRSAWNEVSKRRIRTDDSRRCSDRFRLSLSGNFGNYSWLVCAFFETDKPAYIHVRMNYACVGISKTKMPKKNVREWARKVVETLTIFRRSLIFQTKEFFQNSTLHGVRYIAESGRPVGEK